MNDKDKDKEAFDEWLSDASNHYPDALAYEFERQICFVSWQAACEYKQKDIEEDEELLRNHMNSIGYRELKKLQAENKKLREAVYHVRGMLLRTFGNPYVLGLDVLNEALKEITTN